MDDSVGYKHQHTELAQLAHTCLMPKDTYDHKNNPTAWTELSGSAAVKSVKFKLS